MREKLLTLKTRSRSQANIHAFVYATFSQFKTRKGLKSIASPGVAEKSSVKQKRRGPVEGVMRTVDGLAKGEKVSAIDNYKKPKTNPTARNSPQTFRRGPSERWRAKGDGRASQPISTTRPRPQFSPGLNQERKREAERREEGELGERRGERRTNSLLEGEGRGEEEREKGEGV